MIKEIFCRSIVLLFLMALWGIAVSGCAKIYGLKPEYPKMIFKGEKIRFVEVDSLQPTLKWEPFPRPADKKVDNKGPVSLYSDVTYELKIWRAEKDLIGGLFYSHYPTVMVYFREGLIEPYHRLEEPLEPATKYIWTVRASFKLNGHYRVTEWGHLYEHFPFPMPHELVPEPNYYRFKTPPERVDSSHSKSLFK